jgi:putative membrane protein
MILNVTPSWPRIFRQIGRPLALFTVASIISAVLNAIDHPFKAIAIPDLTFTVLGAVLSILLGFRTNSAYGRWWEARQLWGALVNNSRSIARQAVAFTQSIPDERKPAAEQFVHNLVYHQMAFVHSLRCALRKQEPWADLVPFLSPQFQAELKTEKNVPAAILQRMGETVVEAADSGLLSELRLQRMDTTLSDLANVQGGCERIKNTPLPRQYDVYPELFVKLYCLLLPFVLVEELKFLTPVATLLISFAFLVLNRIGKNLEDPFENTVYDTPMTALSRTIEINLRQVLRERELPPPIEPVNGVLW